ncbi:retrovirus-related pol polyprotein from transposon TNT 1-94 [Tanacetum coccineum]
MLDEYLNPPPCVDLQVSEVIAPEPVVSTVIPLSVEEADHDIKVAHMDNTPYVDFLIPELSSKESSSQVVIPNNVHSVNQPTKHINKWTKDHPIDNVIGDPSRPVSTRHQLQDAALFCYFDAFLSSVEPKSYKEALTESCWIEAVQEELNEFERLKVWEMVPCPDRVMIITLKWIYKVKLDELGVARLEAIRIFIAFAAHMNMIVYQIDVKTAFLNDILREEISQSPKGIFLNQSKYAPESLKKYGMETYDPVDTPMVEKSKWDEDPQGKAVDPTCYRRMIGTLMYLTSSRADLVFTVCMCARYQANPTKKHLHAMLTMRVAKIPEKVRHATIRHQIIKEQVENGVVEMYFVRTEYQLAYTFTKPLARERLNFLINKLGMRSMSPETLQKLADEKEE